MLMGSRFHYSICEAIEIAQASQFKLGVELPLEILFSWQD
jgi:hypothetical protein